MPRDSVRLFHVADWEQSVSDQSIFGSVHGAALPARGGIGIERRWRGAQIETHCRPAPNSDWSASWLANCHVCLLCADVVDVSVALEVNARCLEYGVRLLPGLVMGTIGQIGPVIEAGESACLQCVHLRLQAATGRSYLAAYGPADPQVARLVGQELAGRAARLLNGAGGGLDRRLTYYRPDGSATDHPVLRTWHCPQCAHVGSQPTFGQPERFQLWDRPPSDPRHILELRDELVDPLTGPIRTLERVEVSSHDPPVKHWTAALADGQWAAVGYPTVYCGGNNLDDDRAQAAALGEAIERMSSCRPASADLMAAPYRDVATDAFDPRAWDLFDSATRAEAGFPYAAVSPDDPITWIWGWSLTSERPILVPASRVFVPFRPQTPADNADYPSLGAAATGCTLEEAALGAVLETVERDAFMIAWANRLRLPRLELDRSSRGGVGDYVAAFEDRGLEVRCVLLTLDLGAPVVVAMARSVQPGDPSMVVATAAGLDAMGACRHALAELAANRLNVRHAMATRSSLPACDPHEVIDETAHGLLYARPDMAIHLEPWWDSPATVALPRPSRQLTPWAGLRRLVNAIAAADLETIVVDLTPPEIRDLGLSMVKALVPGAYPINFDSRWLHLGGHRMRAAPVTAGLLDVPLPFEALNRIPHPFP
ncbi:MAG: TOMM precursor leader peptide-binding protein [Pseudonocardiaceae bacterium]